MKCEDDEQGAVKTLRFHLPVFDAADAGAILDLVTAVRGVVAALLDAPAAKLEVAVSSEHSALLVKEQLIRALAGGPAAS